ncbi:cathepsin J isoform X1 [Meriones unguiculatus]|uniref:Cathepsin P n=1 Tax=Meriones unguiculatus TaxID=10047 RepID=Q812A9_MERUN|nr:cathepsin J isoform X1 [Meriones unguiculatus]AAO33583.1 cathepsin P [Meriones unguiculatus]
MTPAVFVVILCFGLALGASVHDPNLDAQWEEWKEKYKKNYSPEVEAVRRAIWEENMRIVKLHNGENGLGKNGFTMELNSFGDLTGGEFRNPMADIPVPAALTVERKDKKIVDGLPKFKNWINEGYVTPVRNQGTCGSCWAFAATGAIEGQMFWKTGKLTPLSVQNLVDCSEKQGNKGCAQGSAFRAFMYVNETKGLQDEISYPYEGKQGTCRYNSSNSRAYVTDFRLLPQNEIYLLVAVASIGPVAAAVDASQDSFRFYRGGIYYEPKCSQYSVNHAVLVVGYGYEGNETDGKDYWLIKNSWGENWGMRGYMKIARDRNNHCGIASQASFVDIF